MQVHSRFFFFFLTTVFSLWSSLCSQIIEFVFQRSEGLQLKSFQHVSHRSRRIAYDDSFTTFTHGLENLGGKKMGPIFWAIGLSSFFLHFPLDFARLFKIYLLFN